MLFAYLRYLIWWTLFQLQRFVYWVVGGVVQAIVRIDADWWVLHGPKTGIFARYGAAAAGAVDEVGGMPLGLAAVPEGGCLPLIALVLVVAFVVGLVLVSIAPVVFKNIPAETYIQNITRFPFRGPQSDEIISFPGSENAGSPVAANTPSTNPQPVSSQPNPNSVGQSDTSVSQQGQGGNGQADSIIAPPGGQSVTVAQSQQPKAVATLPPTIVPTHAPTTAPTFLPTATRTLVATPTSLPAATVTPGPAPPSVTANSPPAGASTQSMNPDYTAAQQCDKYILSKASDARYLQYAGLCDHYPGSITFITPFGPCTGVDFIDPVTGAMIASSKAACQQHTAVPTQANCAALMTAFNQAQQTSDQAVATRNQTVGAGITKALPVDVFIATILLPAQDLEIKAWSAMALADKALVDSGCPHQSFLRNSPIEGTCMNDPKGLPQTDTTRKFCSDWLLRYSTAIKYCAKWCDFYSPDERRRWSGYSG